MLAGFQALFQLLPNTPAERSEKILEKNLKRANDFAERSDRINDLFDKLDAEIANRMSALCVMVSNTQQEAVIQLGGIRTNYLKEASLSELAISMQRNFTRALQRQAMVSKVPRNQERTGQVSQNYLKMHLLPLPPLMSEKMNDLSSVRLNFPLTISHASKREKTEKIVYEGFPPITRNVLTITNSKSVYNGGGRSGRLINPAGIAIHPSNGNVYIADKGNSRIVILSSQLKYIESVGQNGTAPGCFKDISGIAISYDGQTIAAAERGNRRIQIFGGDHSFLAFGTYQSIPGSLTHEPFSVCFDKENNIYASLTSHGVVKFSRMGEVLIHFGGFSSSQLVEGCYGVMVSDENEVYVLPCAGKAVYVFGTDGQYHRKIRIEKTACNWNYLTRCNSGVFSVSDCSGDSVKFYSSNGKLIHSVSLTLPSGIGFGCNDQFYIVSCRDCSIFEY